MATILSGVDGAPSAEIRHKNQSVPQRAVPFVPFFTPARDIHMSFSIPFADRLGNVETSAIRELF
ncbi:MAG: hypothetical protein KDF54_12800, partial [Hydrogenophaga sp.]|nr:hypothetical protein [Hydrogenophaga sp.]